MAKRYCNHREGGKFCQSPGKGKCAGCGLWVCDMHLMCTYVVNRVANVCCACNDMYFKFIAAAQGSIERTAWESVKVRVANSVRYVNGGKGAPRKREVEEE